MRKTLSRFSMRLRRMVRESQAYVYFCIIFLFVLNFLAVVQNRALPAVPNPPEALPLLANALEAPPQEARHHEDDEPPQKLTSNPPEALPLLANPLEAPSQEARHHEDDEPPQRPTSLPAPAANSNVHNCSHCNSILHFQNECPWPRPYPETLRWPPAAKPTPPKQT
jgi:hypothetical protein